MMKRKLNKALLILGGIIISAILIYFIYRDYQPEINLLLHMNDHNRIVLMHLIRSHGIKDMLLLLALIATFNAIPGMSNSLICILAGLCYGPVVGFLIKWQGNILGNCGLIGLTIGFMVPVIPSILVNYAGAQLNINRFRYLAMVTVGMAPTSFIYAFGGDALFQGNSHKLIGAAVAIVVVIAMYVLIKKLIKHDRAAKQPAA